MTEAENDAPRRPFRHEQEDWRRQWLTGRPSGNVTTGARGRGRDCNGYALGSSCSCKNADECVLST